MVWCSADAEITVITVYSDSQVDIFEKAIENASKNKSRSIADSISVAAIKV